MQNINTIFILERIYITRNKSITINEQAKIISELPKDVYFIHSIINISSTINFKEYLSTILEFDKFQINCYIFEIFLLKDGWTKDQSISETNFRVKNIVTNSIKIMSNSELILEAKYYDDIFSS